VFLPDLVIRSRRVVTEHGVRAAAIHIVKERVVGVLGFDDVPPDCPIDDAGEAFLLPGAVDIHVHASDRDGSPDGFDRATRAAAAGGVTTVVDMPFPGPAITTVAALESKRRAASGHCFVDLAFWAGLVPNNSRDLAALVESGVCGFKCVLNASDSDDFSAVSEGDLHTAMPALRRLGAPLLAHAEVGHSPARQDVAWWMTYRKYLERHPKSSENDATEMLIRLCREHRTRTHIVHLSSGDALTPLFRARAERLPVTAETCPHYLVLAADELRANAAVLTTPPIRERENRELLWAALTNGLIQSVASDHVSHTKNTIAGRCGLSSIQLFLPVMWTGAHGRGCSLEQVVEWVCRAPARIAGIARKGRIDAGYDADLVVFDPNSQFTVGRMAEAGDVTPYHGRRLRGIIERTYLRGRLVYSRQGGWSAPRGQLVQRNVS